MQLAPPPAKISPSASLPTSPELTITPIETKTTTSPSGGTPSSAASSPSLSASSPYDPMKRLLSLVPPDHKDVEATKARPQTPATSQTSNTTNTVSTQSTTASTSTTSANKVAQPLNRKLTMAPASPPNPLPGVNQIQVPTQGHRKPHIPIAALPNRPIAPRPAQVSVTVNNNNGKSALLSAAQPKTPPPAPQATNTLAAVAVSAATTPTSIKS